MVKNVNFFEFFADNFILNILSSSKFFDFNFSNNLLFELLSNNKPADPFLKTPQSFLQLLEIINVLQKTLRLLRNLALPKLRTNKGFGVFHKVNMLSVYSNNFIFFLNLIC